MFKFLIASILFSASMALPSSPEGAELFSSWKHRHNKMYATMEEHLTRLEIFLKNRDIVEQHNTKAEEHGWTMALTEFADLTHEEFKNERNGLLQGRLGGAGTHVSSVEAAPTSVDWRTKKAVTDVKNQGSCGSCWAFSTVVSMEGQLALKKGSLVSLSEQNLVDCVKKEMINGSSCCDGCEGGLMDAAFAYMIDKQSGDDDTETSYPYTGANGKCKFSTANAGITISGYKDVASGDEDALKDAVANVGPISVGVDANTAWQLYSGGIMNPWPIIGCSSNPNKMDHGVAVVGYGTDSGKDYWIVKNSWGQTWGESGYIRLAMGKNACGVANQASYPTL